MDEMTEAEFMNDTSWTPEPSILLRRSLPNGGYVEITGNCSECGVIVWLEAGSANYSDSRTFDDIKQAKEYAWDVYQHLLRCRQDQAENQVSDPQIGDS